MSSRGKTAPSALEALFHRFTASLCPEKTFCGHRLLAVDGSSLKSAASPMEQLDLFTDAETAQVEREALAREKKLQETMLGIKNKFGKNAILKGTNLVDGATAADRNGRIRGHKA